MNLPFSKLAYIIIEALRKITGSIGIFYSLFVGLCGAGPAMVISAFVAFGALVCGVQIAIISCIQ